MSKSGSTICRVMVVMQLTRRSRLDYMLPYCAVVLSYFLCNMYCACGTRNIPIGNLRGATIQLCSILSLTDECILQATLVWAFSIGTLCLLLDANVPYQPSVFPSSRDRLIGRLVELGLSGRDKGVGDTESKVELLMVLKSERAEALEEVEVLECL